MASTWPDKASGTKNNHAEPGRRQITRQREVHVSNALTWKMMAHDGVRVPPDLFSPERGGRLAMIVAS